MIGTEEIQLQLEERQLKKVKEKELREMNEAIINGRFDETKEGQVLIKLGYEPFKLKIAEYFGTKTRGQAEKDKNYLKLISDDPSELAYVTLKVLIGNVGHSSTTTQVARALVKHLKKLHFFNKLKEDNPKLHTYLGMEYKRASAKRKRELIAKHIKALYNSDDNFDSVPTAVDVRVGAILIDLLIKSGANVVENITRYKGKKVVYQLVLTDEAFKVLEKVQKTGFTSSTVNMLPMVVPPKDWKGIKDGGYLSYQVSFMKYVTNDKRINKADYSKVFPIINKLQKTPWRVNKRVLDVMYDIFENNMIDPTSAPTLPRCYGGIPSSHRYTAEELIEAPPEYDEKNKKIYGKWNKKRESVQIDLDAEQSRRLDFLITLDIAQEMIDYEKIYFVYTMDYRGRVYAHNEFLNPQTAKHVKAMLEFGEGQYLNDTGVYWLKVHIANLYGKDKLPLDDRVKWVDSNESYIISTATNPMDNISYWNEADSPYEFLASCFAYVDYLSGKKVYTPIQLDATCSGIQFYSGILKDEQGARLVNVIGDKREDIYQEVANKVNEYLYEGKFPKYVTFMDKEGKDRLVSTSTEINSLKGKITRSMVKRNVMTIPYSVSKRGMTDQNWDMMHKMKLEGKAFWEGDDWVVNKIISELVWEASYSILQGAKLGQEYLKEVASTLDTQAFWYTPMFNFPVLQPAYKYKEHRVKTPLGTLTIRMSNEKSLDKRKQTNGIAPNYIHSLDSTLLLYAINQMSTHVGVIHDCFTVLPNQGEEIRNHYKEGYIELMTGNPLEALGKQLDPEGKVEVPSLDTLNLDEVRDSMYIIS